MFDFLQVGVFGSEIESNGEKYIAIYYFQNNYYLAVKPEDTFPCQTFVVKKDKDENFCLTNDK